MSGKSVKYLFYGKGKEIMSTGYQLEDTTEVYDSVKKRFSRQILNNLEAHLPKNATVVEIGPGAGHFAMECLRQEHTYTAIEPSGPIRAVLASMGINAIDASVPPVPMPDGSVDLVYSSMVLEHMVNYVQAVEFIADSARVLRAGGIICLTFPNAYACGKIFWEMDYSHSFYTTPRRVEQMFRHMGIEHVETERVLGWFWAKSTIVHHLARFLSNVVFSVLNTNSVANIALGIGVDGLLWKFRKTFFETAIVVGRVAVEEKKGG